MTGAHRCSRFFEELFKSLCGFPDEGLGIGKQSEVQNTKKSLSENFRGRFFICVVVKVTLCCLKWQKNFVEKSSLKKLHCGGGEKPGNLLTVNGNI